MLYLFHMSLKEKKRCFSFKSQPSACEQLVRCSPPCGLVLHPYLCHSWEAKNCRLHHQDVHVLELPNLMWWKESKSAQEASNMGSKGWSKDIARLEWLAHDFLTPRRHPKGRHLRRVTCISLSHSLSGLSVSFCPGRAPRSRDLIGNLFKIFWKSFHGLCETKFEHELSACRWTDRHLEVSACSILNWRQHPSAATKIALGHAPMPILMPSPRSDIVPTPKMQHLDQKTLPLEAARRPNLAMQHGSTSVNDPCWRILWRIPS